MAGIDNLTPYKPGQSGNPEGKKPGTRNRSTILRELLAAISPTGKTNEFQLEQAIIDKALEGDVSAYKEIKDSLYGKITDTSVNMHLETDEELVPTTKMKAIAKDIAKNLQEQY